MKNGRYQIVTTDWHVMHFWDLMNALKDHADFFLIHNTHRSWLDKTYLAARPIPANAQHVPYYEKGKYDLAILDVDQQCANPALGKTRLQTELMKLITDIPRVVINHGTPVYPEWLCKEGMTKMEAEAECRQLVLSLVGDTPMVVNSYEAASAREWGKGIPIIHGMDPAEWFDLPKEPRVFTALSAAGLEEFYNRACMNEAKNILHEKFGYTLWWAKENVDTHTSWDFYREYLGKSLVYLDTSLRTPMNRARTEAMLSGCCVVQARGAHDLDRFAKDGENMILVDNDPNKIANLVADLIENRYDECIQIGQAGKQTAMQMFSRERYRDDWLRLIDHLTTGQEL